MHFFIVPRIDSDEWVSAVRLYALRFGITLTSSLETVLQLASYEDVVVSLIDGPVSYGFHDAEQWLLAHNIIARIDAVKAESPAELRAISNYRVEAGDPLVLGSHGTILDVEPVIFQGAKLAWPTTYYDVIQPFGDNPALYLAHGLPGHSGIDIAAPANSPVFAAADGEVYRVHDGRGRHPCGIHICIQHPNGLSTIYAHLNKPGVSSGMAVSTGQLIGRVGATGAVSYPHLHFAVRLPGAYSRGLTVFPGDYLDPADYLVLDAHARQRANAAFTGGSASFVSGINLPGGDIPVEFLLEMGFRGVRVNASNPDLDLGNLQWLIEQGVTVLAFLPNNLSKRYAAPHDYAGWVTPGIARLSEIGVRYFELHQLPNTAAGGLGTTWANGAEFGDWFAGVVGRLRACFFDVKFGYPAVSVGPSIRGVRTDGGVFIEQSRHAMQIADWVASRAYWQSADDIYLGTGGLSFEVVRQWISDKPIILTEFGCLSRRAEPIRVAAQYRAYWEYLSHIPQIVGAYAFSPSPEVYPNLVWLEGSGERAVLAQAFGGNLS